MTTESFVDLSHIRRMTAPPAPKQDDLPFPDVDPADIIEGPRISLRYGSAATVICISKRLWRRTDVGDRFSFQGRWRSVEDWRDTDCLRGKWVRVTGEDYEGVAELDDEGFLSVVNEDVPSRMWLQPEDVTVVPNDKYLNPFEQAISKAAEGAA